MKQIHTAVVNLYGAWDSISDSSRTFIENVMEDGDFEKLYEQIAKGEQETKSLLIQFDEKYPGVAQEGNVDSIAENLQKKADKATVLAELRKRKNMLRNK